ncbi:MAG: mandelate racemase/muconate lactonizing enzyme family protein [Candidatus Latescibacterota bacterium]|jgi:L-alanine-DL-glutamate epimerase-like enolase superfamily enzyme
MSTDTQTIETARSYLLRVPVPHLRVDSQSTLESWDVLAVELVSASGLSGWGYQCGFGAAMAALKHFIDGAILPELTGRDASCHRQWWSELYLQRHHTGLNGPAIQGVSSPEVAAWDLMARAADVPLWMLLGGRCRDRILCYDTNGGWLGYALDELLENVKRSVDEGFRGVKVKIGSADFAEDLRRLEAVRTALGDDIMIATDVNNRWDLQTALQCAPALADFDVAWLEEPLYPFDVRGHAELASRIDTPLLHGENLYEPLMIRDMLDAGALDIVQPSDMKLGGLSRWLEVAALARTAGKRVVPAGWTMLQIDQHLAAATPHCWMVESIPWIRDIFVEPARFEDGYLLVPETPGASTAIKPELLEEYAIS